MIAGSDTGNGAGWPTRVARSGASSNRSTVASMNSSRERLDWWGSPAAARRAGLAPLFAATEPERLASTLTAAGGAAAAWMSRFDCCQKRTSFVSRNSQPLATMPCRSGDVPVRSVAWAVQVTAGSTSATTPLYVMTQNDPMRIFVDAPQSAAADLLKGSAPVQIQSNGGVMRDFSGKVSRTSQAINPQARTLRVEVDIPNPRGDFVPGMYVKVGFALPPRGLVQAPAAHTAATVDELLAHADGLMYAEKKTSATSRLADWSGLV